MLTRSKLAQLQENRVKAVTLAAPGRRPPLSRWLGDDGVVTGRWPAGLGVTWVAVFAAAFALEPSPADPRAAVPAWVGVMSFAMFAALGTMAAGLGRRQRLGLVASVVAGGVGLFGAVMCPVSGHHESIGAWWYLQMAGFTGLIGASLVGLRRSRPASPSSAG